MTNFEYIKSLSKRELAEMLLTPIEIMGEDEDWDGNLIWSSMGSGYRTSDGTEFFDDSPDDAIRHEMKWLNRPYISKE